MHVDIHGYDTRCSENMDLNGPQAPGRQVQLQEKIYLYGKKFME